MDDSRVFRISVSGSILIISVLLNFWIIGGDFYYLGIEKDNIQYLIGIIIAIASSPVIGFIFSTITVSLLQLFCGYKLHFHFSNISEERQHFYNDLLILSHSQQQKNRIIKIMRNLNNKPISSFALMINRADKAHLREVFNTFELVIKIHAQKDITDYMVRRWNIFWTHVNIIASLFYGFIIALILRFHFDNVHSLRIPDYDVSFTRLLIEVPIIIYVIAGLWQLLHTRSSAVRYENRWLSEISSNYKSSAQQRV
jgi:hypothetical protein